MAIELGRRLVAYGVVPPEEVEAALFLSVVRGVTFVRALVDRGAVDERALEEELGHRGGLALRHVLGVPELMARLPPAMCRRLGAVPTRLDTFTGTVDVAAADPLDPHIASEFGFHLGAPIRVIRAPVSAIEEAIRRVELEDSAWRGMESRSRRSTPAFPHGAPNSSLPPPPVEDVPIPLVRRLGVPLIDVPDEVRSRGFDDPQTIEAETRRRLETEVALPLRNSKLHRANLTDDLHSAFTEIRDEPIKRPPVLREPRDVPPSVSFPSDRPPATEELDLETARRHRPASSVPPAWIPGRPIVAPAPQSARGAALGRPAVQIDVPAPRGGADGLQDGWQAAAEPKPAQTGPPPLPVPRPAEREGPPPLPLADGPTMMRTMREAGSRDEVVRVAIRALRTVARRVAVFAIKRNAFQGWACNPEFGDESALRAVNIPLVLPSVLATATAASIYLGPIPATPAHAPLLAVMGEAGHDVAVVAVRANGRPVMLLLADELTDTLTGTRRMDELARAAGDALSRLLAGRPSQ